MNLQQVTLQALQTQEIFIEGQKIEAVLCSLPALETFMRTNEELERTLCTQPLHSRDIYDA